MSVEEILLTHDIIFVCQKSCIVCYKTINIYKDLLLKLKVAIITDTQDLPFIQIFENYAFYDYQTYKDVLFNIGIATAPFFIVKKENKIIKIQPFSQESQDVINAHFKKLK